MAMDFVKSSSISYLVGSLVTMIISTDLAIHGAIAGTGDHGWEIYPLFVLPLFLLIGVLSPIASTWGISKISCDRSRGLTMAIILSFVSFLGNFVSLLCFHQQVGMMDNR
jgi:hypothetical protein